MDDYSEGNRPADAGEAPPENLLSRLFSYRPREKLTPAENFLTEAFAYLLATDASLQGPIIEHLTAGHVLGAHSISVQTQILREDEESEKRCIPDAIVCGLDQSGADFELWLENKWGSAVDVRQLDQYCQILSSRSVHFAFVSPSVPDVAVARARLLEHANGTYAARLATTWSEIQARLGSRSDSRSLRVEFAEFLQVNGLGGLRLVTRNRAKDYWAFLSSKREGRLRGRVGDNDNFLRDLQAICARALSINTAGGDLVLEDVEMHDGWGRVACMTADRRLSVGLLYSPIDHRTGFLNPDQPLDIVVRVQAPPEASTLAQRRSSLIGVRESLEGLQFECDPDGGRWKSNPHTLLLGHYRPGFPFDAASGEAQSEALALVFANVWRVLKAERFAGVLNTIGAYRVTR
jgi:hypothetical protein